jgi:hypothetical protein
MADAILELNSVRYVLAPLDRAGTFVRRVNNPNTVERFSQGQQTIADLRNYLVLRWPNLSLGLGRYRIDSDSATKVDEYRRFFDSTNDTRWADACGYLPVRQEDSTHTGLELLWAGAAFKGNLWAIWSDDTSTDLVARKYTGGSTTWEGGGYIDNSALTLVGLDIIAQKTHLMSLEARENDHLSHRSTDGASWSAASTNITANLLSNNVTAGELIDAGLLADIGGESVAIVWHESNGTITFFSSTDAGDNWADEAVDIASGNGPQGVAVLAGIDNEDKLYVGTREGLYEVDTAPSTWTFRLVFAMTPNNDNCRRMVLHSDGALWFAQGVDDDSPPIVYRMFIRNGERQIEVVPNDFSLGDGLPAEAAGPIRWMVSVQGMLYASAGGGDANRKARIWCHNGKGWHSVRKHGTADEEIRWIAASADDDGTPRLHYAIRTGTTVDDVNFLGQPFVNPRSGVTIKREASGYTDLPYVDGGFGIDTKNFVRISINAEDLSASNSGEYINVDRGITTDLGALAARNATDVGDYLSGIGRITLGTNGVGIGGKVIGLRVNLNRNSTETDTPIWKDTQIEALVKIAKTKRYEFLVDLEKTAALEGRQTTAVIADLDTADTSDVFVPIAYADLTTDYVDVEEVGYSETIIGQDGTQADQNARRHGTVRVVVSEAL